MLLLKFVAFLLDRSCKAEVDQLDVDWLLLSRFEHYILRLYISVHYVAIVKIAYDDEKLSDDVLRELLFDDETTVSVLVLLFDVLVQVTSDVELRYDEEALSVFEELKDLDDTWVINTAQDFDLVYQVIMELFDIVLHDSFDSSE